MSKVYVALGSNIGDREQYLRAAVARLDQEDGVNVLRLSSFINTKAVTSEPQDDYLNAVVELETSLTLRDFFQLTQGIESVLGRQDKGNQAPRTLDLDILFFDDTCVSDTDLVVPHAGIQNRLFVLEPLRELVPDFVHPVLKQTVQTLYDQCHEMAV